MKRWLIGLLVLLVLTGCSQQPESTTADTTLPTTTTPPTGIYDPESLLEQQTGGAIKIFPLGTDGCLQVQPMGQAMLTISLGANSKTELTILQGDQGLVQASAALEGISVNTVQASQDRIACYDFTQNSILILDGALHVIDRIALPSGISGNVVFDESLLNAYFTTGNQIRALDLTTETPRLLHQHDCLQQELHSVIRDGKILVCLVEDAYGSYYEFIDTQTGQTLGKDNGLLQLDTWQDRYFLRRTDGTVTENLFGRGSESLQQLNVDAALLYGVPGANGVVAVSDEAEGLLLSFFDLQTGHNRAIATLPGCHAIYSICDQAESGTVWFVYEDSDLCEDILCCWDPGAVETEDKTVYTTRRYTADAPDTEGLALCTQRAEALNAAYGIEILFNASPKQPSEYTLKPEFQVSLVNAGLDAIETALAALPEGFVKEFSSVSDAPLQISLVRSIQNVAGQAPGDGTGLQYWADGDACIALCVTETVLQDFYHQLFHVLETYLYSESSELDLWEKLNPKGFSYDHNYLNYTQHEDSKYLQGDSRAFVDAFSMTYPREDRARIFEYAMMAGNEDFFRSEVMQEKLHQLCYCIRDAYGLRRSELTYPWEQYLEESLAYKKRK